MSTQRIAYIGLLSSLSFVTRGAFTFLPNVQPTTVIFLIIAITFGTRDAILVSGLSMLISNMYLGFGIWTIPQIASYIIIILLFRWVVGGDGVELPMFVILAFLSGILYGFFISIMNIPYFGWGFFWVYYLNGLTFDIAHAVGNVCFGLLLFPILVPMFNKQASKLRRL